MYHSATFNTVVFTAAEFNYWAASSEALPLSAGPFFPRKVVITSDWEVHTVLLSLPAGAFSLSPREASWESDLQKALREALADLSADIPANLVARDVLRTWIGTKQPATGMYVIPIASSLDYFSRIGRHNFHRQPVCPAAAVAADAVVAPHRRTMGSSASAPERVIPRSAGPGVAAPVPALAMH